MGMVEFTLHFWIIYHLHDTTSRNVRTDAKGTLHIKQCDKTSAECPTTDLKGTKPGFNVKTPNVQCIVAHPTLILWGFAILAPYNTPMQLNIHSLQQLASY